MVLKNKKRKIPKRNKGFKKRDQEFNSQQNITPQKQEPEEQVNNVLEYLAPDGIVVGHSDVAGIGVFATKDFKKGDIVERCPMVRMEHRSKYVTDPTINNYMYTQPLCPCNDCKNHGYYYWMVLGYGMIYNHQDFPTVDWQFNWAEKYADVVANQDIEKGEEIFVTYGNNYFGNNSKRQKTLPKSTMDQIDTVLDDIDDDFTFLRTVDTYMKTVKREEDAKRTIENSPIKKFEQNKPQQKTTKDKNLFRPWNT